MNKDDYKAAFDSVKFSANFEQDTVEYLLRAADCRTQKHKEIIKMKSHNNIRKIVIAVAIIAILTTSAFALTVLLSPKEVATHTNDSTLAKAFDSENAVNINKSVQAGDYTITLEGIVSGRGLTDYCGDVQEDKSYIVAAVSYADGHEITADDDICFTFTPLVQGYEPWLVNAWTLSGGYTSFINEGVKYFIFECSNIEIFADNTIYLAAYEGDEAPSAGIFTIRENGDIVFAEGFDEPHAMFTLPLDSSKADSNAVNEFLKSNELIE